MAKIKAMEVIVDTNVIADVLNDDPLWASWSKRRLVEQEGGLLINPIIYAELCYRADSSAAVDQIIAGLGLRYKEFSRSALFLAAKAFRSYRQRGGIKSSPLADFFIGTHAEAAGLTILTRDPARYRTYFPAVPLICPLAGPEDW